MRVTRRSSREGAFTIVEVIIAALIVTIVFAGAVYFIAGSGHSQQRTMVRQRMASVADDISQRVRATDQWLKTTPSCKQAECDVSSQFPSPAAKPGDPSFATNVRITPIDSAGDGQEPNDADHVTPDFYRIKIIVTLPDDQVEKWGKQSPFETVSTVDATALGRAVGSITVQTCEAVNQVDERKSIASCQGGSGDMHRMNRQPEPCTSPFPLSWNGWLTARPVLPLGCNNAYDAAKSEHVDSLISVHARGVTDVDFKLVRDGSDGGPTTARLSTDADTASGNGTYVFSGLPAGTYNIAVTPGAGRELWATHTIPSALKTSVQANQEARALIMVRPKQGTGTYRTHFARRVFIYHLKTETAQDSYEETYDGTTVRTTTTFTYLVGGGPRKEVWDGPAWNGILSMEPKPFDRYRNASNVVSQPTTMAAWAPAKAANGGWITLGGLPTGLHSLPKQQPKPQPAPDDFWGSFGNRTEDCFPSLTPGSACGNFAWIDFRPGHLGDANGTVSYFSEDGECYLESSVEPFVFARRLQNGGGHADRCSRDLHYRNPETGHVTNVENFLPNKNGDGGKRILIGMRQSTTCVAGCEYVDVSGGEGDQLYADPSSTNTSGVNDPPPVNSASPPRIIKKSPPDNPAPPVSLPAATAVPSAGGGSGGGGTVLPGFGK